MTFISGFRRDVDEICPLLGYYAASCGNCLTTFRGNVSVPSSSVKKSLNMEPIRCPETSINNYHTTRRKYPGRAQISYNLVKTSCHQRST